VVVTKSRAEVVDVAVAETLGGPPSFTVARRDPEQVSRLGAWNSWDSHRLTVGEAAIRAALATIQREPWLRDFVRSVIVDDAWENMVGDWEPNERLPSGMGGLAEAIRDAGCVPGIWVAPFAGLDCGPPWGDRCYLDTRCLCLPQAPPASDYSSSWMTSSVRWRRACR